MDESQISVHKARLSAAVVRPRGDSGISVNAWDLRELEDSHELAARRPSTAVVRASYSLNTTRQLRFHSAEYKDYDPENDVKEARKMASKKRRISILSLFRYATRFDSFLMIIGALISIVSGVFVPWLFYRCGTLFLVFLMDFRCPSNIITPNVSKTHADFMQKEVEDFRLYIISGGIILFACNYISWRIFAWTADLQTKRISLAYFEWVLRKDLAWFDTYVDREFSNLMTEEIAQIRAGIGEKIPALLQHISIEISMIIFCLVLNYKLALFLFLMSPIFYIISHIGAYADNSQTVESAKIYAEAGKLAEEILCNIKMTKVYQGEEKNGERYSSIFRKMPKSELKSILLASTCAGILWCWIYWQMSIALWICTGAEAFTQAICLSMKRDFVHEFVVNGKEWHFDLLESDGPHTFALVFMAVTYVASNSMDIPYFLKEFQDARRRAAEVLFLIDWKPRIDNLGNQGTLPKAPAIGRIEVRGVGFRFPRNTSAWVLRDVSMTIYPQQIIGLFGREGSGKSTLLKLIMRLYDVCEGEVTLDSMDVRGYNVQWLRSQFAVISHDTIVFPLSIKENLKIASENATMDQIYDVCKIAEIHDRIMELQEGYDTILKDGNRSRILTAQELRQIAIARVMLIKPRILFMDDPVVSNDDGFERIVGKLITYLTRFSTIIVACSRANQMMKRFDHIYYMEGGKIVEDGTHSQLLHKRGGYYQMLEDTLDSIFEERPQFTSQLTAYKFAKSLRKLKAKKRKKLEAIEEKANKAKTKEKRGSNDSRRSSKDEGRRRSTEIMLDLLHHTNDIEEEKEKPFYYLGFGVGGFQKYHFSKVAAFNPGRIAKFLKKKGKTNAKSTFENSMLESTEMNMNLRRSSNTQRRLRIANNDESDTTIFSSVNYGRRSQNRSPNPGSTMTIPSVNEPKGNKKVKIQGSFQDTSWQNLGGSGSSINISRNRSPIRMGSKLTVPGGSPRSPQRSPQHSPLRSSLKVPGAGSSGRMSLMVPSAGSLYSGSATSVRRSRTSFMQFEEEESVPHFKRIARIADVGSGGVHLSGTVSTDRGLLTRHKSTAISEHFNEATEDDISINSEDSQEFWNDYCDKLEALKHIHEGGSWLCMLRLIKSDCLTWIWILLGCISSIILGCGLPCSGFLIGTVYFSFAQDKEPRNEEFLEIALYFLALGFCTGVGGFGQEFFFSLAGKRYSSHLRTRLFISIINQDMAWFDKPENDISILSKKLAIDTDTVQHVLLTTMGIVLQNLTTVAVAVTLSFLLYKDMHEITLLLCAGCAIALFTSYVTGRLIYDQVASIDMQLEKPSELAYHILSGIRPCIIMHLERYFLKQFRHSLTKSFRFLYFKSELRCLFYGAYKSWIWIHFGLFVYFAFNPPNEHHTYTPDVKYIFIMIEMMIFGLKSVGECVAMLTHPSLGKEASQRIIQILHSHPQLCPSKYLNLTKLDKNMQPPKIQLYDVHYQYSDVEILRGISLEIAGNSIVAIVGLSEAGKTTLANIFLRLIAPTFGTILIDDIDVSDIEINSLRKIIALVEQDSALLHDMTIMENIQFGDNSRQVTPEEVEKAARAARVHFEILDLPDGYETKMDPTQVGVLSHSFKQKISLARALIKNPKILIIDDATTSLDSEHDEMIRKAIQDASEDRTLIMFSQKIDPIRHADMIFVIEKGVIVESGDDASLLDKQGAYYDMYMTQRLLNEAAGLTSQRNSKEDSETIEILKRQAQSAQSKRKSSIAYKKFLSIEMDRMKEHLKGKGRTLNNEEIEAKVTAKYGDKEDHDTNQT